MCKKEVNTEKKEVLIQGRFYDVTDFKHPGGTILNFYINKPVDATEPFFQFHLKSKTAQKFLDSRPSREAKPNELVEHIKGQKKLMEDFIDFRNQLEKEGYYKPNYFHIIYRIIEIIAIYAFGIYLLLNNNYFGIIPMAIAQGRCGWAMHEGGHVSLTGNVKTDIFLQEIIYGVGCGMSGGWWRSQHNKHHSKPQHLGYDVDLNTLPLVAFTNKIFKNKKLSFNTKKWISLQKFLFPILTTLLVALSWQLILHPRHIMRKKLKNEAIAIGIRYFLWTVLITAKFGLFKSALIYLAYVWFGANYIFISFAMSHTHLPTVEKDDDSIDWVRYSSDYTMNVSPGPFNFVNWWMGYLNFQIEHHLFPGMPQYRFPKLSPRVKKFFEDHGLKYDQRSYTESLGVTFKNLDKVGADVFLG